MRTASLAAFLGVSLAGPACAEVKRVELNGFQLESRVIVPVSPEQAFVALGQPELWWSPAHTYSGNSRNLTMGLKAGECFCERIPADSSTIEHGRVVYSRPGATLRLQASLGPLQSEGVAGALTWSLKRVPAGTEITQTYIVGGFFRQGAAPLAPLVDQVISDQLMRLGAHLGASRKQT